MRGTGRVAPPSLARRERGPTGAETAIDGSRRVLLGRGREADVAAYDRVRLRPGMSLAGPALVAEYSATTWVPERCRLEVDEWGSLVLDVSP